MAEIAATLGRNSRERHALRQAQRQRDISDAQFDHDIEREEAGERSL